MHPVEGFAARVGVVLVVQARRQRETSQGQACLREQISQRARRHEQQGCRRAIEQLQHREFRIPAVRAAEPLPHAVKSVRAGHPDLGSLALTAGLKLEDDPYSGWTLQPDARLSWMMSESEQLWAAASRAIRAPTPFDRDVVEKVGGLTFLTGNAAFRPERVTAYELGYRALPSSRFSVSASVFYNHYDDLRTVDPASATVFLPLHWGNAMEGSTYGVETWADLQVLSWWRLTPGLRTLHKQLRFKPGAAGLLGTGQAGDDPTAQGFLTSSMDLPLRLTWDASLRYVNALPDPVAPGYYGLDTRLGWRASPQLELALVGRICSMRGTPNIPLRMARRLPVVSCCKSDGSLNRTPSLRLTPPLAGGNDARRSLVPPVPLRHLRGRGAL